MPINRRQQLAIQANPNVRLGTVPEGSRTARTILALDLGQCKSMLIPPVA